MRPPSNRQPWLIDLKFRLRFERGLSRAFPELQIRETGRTLADEVIYSLTLPVTGYESRRLTIKIKNGYRPYPRVFADGPEDSPHRYSDGSLCMWHPKDLPEEKWLPAEGLLTLVRYAQLHLFREAWLRETGEWVGEEAGHGLPSDKETEE
jgi:hypothetical protein